MRTALIIGTTGQLARALAETPSDGLTYRALGRAELDLADTDQIRSAVSAANPAIVINTAAYTAVDKAETDRDMAFRINRDAPEALASAAAGYGAPFIHVSTDYVYPGSKKDAYTEGDETGPINVYGASKLAGEQAALAANPRTAILRTSWVYAPWGQNFVKTMLRLGTERRELNIVGDQRGCPTSALSLARAIAAIAPGLQERPEADPVWGIYNYAGKGAASWAEFASAIFAGAEKCGLIDTAPKVTPITSAEYPTPAKRPENSMLDCSKFERNFDIQTEKWQGALAETLDRIAEGVDS